MMLVMHGSAVGETINDEWIDQWSVDDGAGSLLCPILTFSSMILSCLSATCSPLPELFAIA